MNKAGVYLLACAFAGVAFTGYASATEQVGTASNGGPGTSSAASAAPANEGQGALTEIIVTARKRSEDIQMTPISITALTFGDLERQGNTSVTSLAADVPSLSIEQSDTGVLGGYIGMRGQQSTDIVITQTPPVGIYIDGVYYPTSLATGLDNFEGVQQIEVLKGPQGTLYGRNTTGGAINITTKLPDYSGIDGTIKVGYGNYDERTVAGSINIPLVSNRAALSITGQFVDHNGYGRDFGNGIPLEELQSESFRAALRLDLTDNFQIVVRGDVAHALSSQNIENLVYVQPGFSIASAAVAVQTGAFSPGDFQILGGLLTTGAPPPGTTAQQLASFFGDVNKGRNAFASYMCPHCYYNTFATPASLTPFGLAGAAPIVPNSDVSLQTASITGQYQFNPDLYLKSITAYQYTRTETINSLSASPFLLINGLTDAQNPHEVTQELQLGGTSFDNQLKWVTGYYFLHLNGYDNGGPVLEVVPFEPNPLDNLANLTDQSSSIFSQATYSVTGTVNFTGGVRYTTERTKLIETSRNAAGCAVTGIPAAGVPCFGDFYNKFDNTSYTAGLDWSVTRDFMAYVKTSTGFRAGGTNQRGPAVPFAPETVTDYEVGLKSEWLDHRLRANVAVYNSNYNNIQRSINILYEGTLQSAVQNAAKARITGLELETTALLTDYFQVTLNGAYTNARYLSYMGISGTGAPVNFVGTPFPNLSRWQGNLAGTYIVPEPIGKLSGTLSYAYRTTLDYTPGAHGTMGAADAVIQPSYGLLNARISQYVNSWNVDIAAWARNLTNKQYAAGALDFTGAGLGYAVTLPGNPRTFGIEVRKNF